MKNKNIGFTIGKFAPLHKGHPFFSMSKDYRELDIAISKLTDKQRYVIINHYYKKKSLSTIAKKLKMNSNAVYQLKVRALLSLKRFMED